jgi:hypothetical protein
MTTVLEINPRPTTSLVGLVHLLPPGALARAWLDLAAGAQPALEVHGMIPPGTRGGVRFSADGTIHEHSPGIKLHEAAG